MIEWLIQEAADSQTAALPPPEGLLSAQETAVYNDLHSAKRRSDWLLGRRTAKKLLQASLEKSGIGCPSSCEIAILAAADGAPEVWFAGDSPLRRADCNISISHAHDVSFCAAISPRTHLLGADIEYIQPRSRRFVEDYFTNEEKDLVRQASPEFKDCLITAVWSGKEAALKAVRQGLRLDTRTVNCLFTPPFELCYDWSPFTIVWASERAHSGYPNLAGWWRLWQAFVLTLVVTTKPAVSPQ